MAKISHILPPLSDKAQLQQLDAPGSWEPVSDSSILVNISRGLRVVSQHENEKYLVSVPDVWARSEIVKTALFEKEHRLHQQVTREWRGLLGLIALSDYHGYKLTAEIVDIKKLEQKPYQARTSRSGDQEQGNLGSVINDLLPSTLLSSENNWGEISLLRCNGNPIGLIVPSTIVCGGRNIGDTLNDMVPWCSNGELKDPCKTTNVQLDEFASLKRFLEELDQKIKDEGTEVDTTNGITTALTQFLDDCNKKFEEMAGDEGILNRLTSKNNRFELPQQPIYSALNQTFGMDYSGEESFDTVIKSREEFNKFFKGAVLADERMAKTADRPAARIKIWGNHSLQTYIDSDMYHEEIETSVTDSSYLLLRPEKLFAKQLCYIDDDYYLTTHSRNRKAFILPFDPLILLLYSAEEIDKRTKITKTGRGYKVSFQTTLSKNKGRNWDHLLEKEYAEEDVVSRKMPGSISHWPNFSHKDWKWYYFFFAGDLRQNFAPRGLFSQSEICDLLEAAPDKPKLMKSISDLANSMPKLGKKLPLQETQLLFELYLMESGPEALVCDAVTSGEVTGFVPAKDREFLGILLLPTSSASAIKTSAREAAVGIDFGTTNTSAYLKIQNNKSSPIEFEDRLISPIVASEDNPQLSRILREFFPHDKIGVPFLTILRDRDLPEETTQILPAWNSHLYYVSDLVNSIEDVISDTKRDLKFNLKWSKSPSDRQLVRQYMAQVVMQCLAELFSRGIKPQNIDWKFSYPEAYPPSQLEDFIAICSSATKMAISPDSADSDFTPKIHRQSESLSTALYFIAEQRAYMVQNAITIDIGGHTSDISIWQSRNLVWRNSLEVAGRHIFIDYLKQNIGLLEQFAKSSPKLAEGLKQLKNEEDPDRFGYGLEILVNSPTFSEIFERDFELVGGVREGELLKQISLVALSGILFYTGLTIRHLYKTGVLEKLPNTHMSVCLGGRGSLVYKAIFRDGVEDVREKEGILKLFCETIGDSIESASFIFSGHHKHEVAYGLLVDTEGDKDLDLVSKRSNDVLIGEEFKIGRTKIESNSLISNLPKKGQWRLDEVVTVHELVDLLSSYLGIKIDLDKNKKAKNDLIGRISSQLVGAQDRMAKEAGLAEKLSDDVILTETDITEPVFIIVLRSMLELIVSHQIPVEYLPE